MAETSPKNAKIQFLSNFFKVFIIISVLCGFIILLLFVFVPLIADVFADSGVEIPVFLRGLMTLSDLSRQFWVVILPLMVVMAICGSLLAALVWSKGGVVGRILVSLLLVLGTGIIVIGFLLSLYLSLVSLQNGVVSVKTVDNRIESADSTYAGCGAIDISLEDSYRVAKGQYFWYSYPGCWHVNVQSEDGELVERFYMDPNPIQESSDSTFFLSGEGKEVSIEPDLDDVLEKAEDLDLYENVEELDWSTGDFEGVCYRYDQPSARWGWDGLDGNIRCVISIEDEKTDSWVEYEFFSRGDRDGSSSFDESVLKKFFSSLSEVDSE